MGPDPRLNRLGIDYSRPMLKNSDGSFSTVRSFSINIDGKEILLPSIVNGKQYTQEEAIRLYQQGINKPLGVFNSPEEATRAAKDLSYRTGLARNPSSGLLANLGRDPYASLDETARNVMKIGQPQPSDYQYSAGGLMGLAGDIQRQWDNPSTGTIAGIKSMLTSPGRAAMGERIPEEEAVAFGMGLVGGGTAFGPEVGAGTLGMNLGPLSTKGKAPEMQALLKKAQNAYDLNPRVREGARFKQYMKKKYEWFPDAEGNWMFQVSDLPMNLSERVTQNIKARFDPEELARMKRMGTAKDEFVFGDVIRHPDLINGMYSTGLDQIKIKFNEGLGSASGRLNYGKSTKGWIDTDASIELNPKVIYHQAKKLGIPVETYTNSVILHEAQHLVQMYEGWPLGSNPEFFEVRAAKRDEYLERIDDLTNRIKQTKSAASRKKYQQSLDYYEKQLRFAEDIIDQSKEHGGVDQNSYMLYFNTFGEQGARSVESQYMAAKRVNNEEVYKRIPTTAVKTMMGRPYTVIKENPVTFLDEAYIANNLK